MKKPGTLYGRTSLTIFVALFIFMVFASVVVFQYLMQPIARQAAGDLAAFMVMSAQTWVELSPDARSRFENELKDYHEIIITEKNKMLEPVKYNSPFFRFLKQALEERLEQPIQLFENQTNNGWIWVGIPMSQHFIQIGFPYSHIKPDPPKVFFLLMLGAAVLIFLTSSILVRRLTKPLENLSQATMQMGRGKPVAPLKETGAKEFILLTRSFNQMNHRVQQLLNNRNTLLGGISHDLRTPIARIYLALELLETNKDPELINSIRNDLNEMNQFLEQTLELAISPEKAIDKLKMMDLSELISSEVAKFKQESQIIEWHPVSSCKTLISQTAFQRILQNLIENALRYGEGLPVKISLTCDHNQINVCITDQGAGIPESHQSDIFQPFFRLESSRNANTGGSGLGLAIVSQLCEIYGWTIKLSNEKKGCTFCLAMKRQAG